MQKDKSPRSHDRSLRQFWVDRLHDWYPNLLQETYFLPSVLTNRIQLEEVQVSGERVLVPTGPTETPLGPGDTQSFRVSDVREDHSHTSVVKCLQHIAADHQTEVMFVISKLDYEDYLSEPRFSAVTSKLPRPRDLKEENMDRGDFDLLIIHRQYGILVGEIKAVGNKLSEETVEKKKRQIIAARIEKALTQLAKAESVLKHVLSDQPFRPCVRKRVLLPNLSSDCLRDVFNHDPELSEKAKECLQAGDCVDLTQLCLTSDKLQTPSLWWEQCLANFDPDTSMTDEVYLELVARLGGPATTVKVFCPSLARLGYTGDLRTLSQAVMNTSAICTLFVIHPHQLSILRDDEAFVFLTGPPGTGKTLVLVLKALEWLREGYPVYVVSIWDESLPVSHKIVQQLKLTYPDGAQNVHLLPFRLWKEQGGPEVVVESLVEKARAKDGVRLRVIADEIGPDSFYPQRRFSDVCSKLKKKIPDLRIWAASMYHGDNPENFVPFTLTEPLRTPPTVTREVAMSNNLGPNGQILGYSQLLSPPPVEGLPPSVVLHTDDHEEEYPADCFKCGYEVGNVLKKDLGVGDSAVRTGINTSEPSNQLRYKDVVIILRLKDLNKSPKAPAAAAAAVADGNREEIVDCAFVQGLRSRGVPVRTLKDAAEEVATMAGPDEVLLTWSGMMHGLERPLVVWTRYDDIGEEWGRTLAMSRCTGHLIVVKTPDTPDT